MTALQKTQETFSSYYKRRTKVWASILGDAALIMIPVINKLIADAPNMNETQKYWWAGVFTIIGIGAKFALKLVKEHEEA
jgi:hypothetical protein